MDDLWHATINGRGKMYLATTAEETALRIQSGLTDILSQTGAQGGIAVSTVNLPRGDSKAYFGTYNPAGWAGDLTANAIDPATGSVTVAPTWSAAGKLLRTRLDHPRHRHLQSAPRAWPSPRPTWRPR